jgi:hypothetical protein
MKSSQSRLPLVFGLGWLATAAIAFCIGRIGSSSGVPARSEAAASGAGKADSASHGNGDAAGFSAGPGSKGQFGMGDGDGPLTVTRVTNGQPIDKWMKHLMAQEDNLVRMNGLLRFLEAVTDPEDLKIALAEVNLRGDRGRGARFMEYAMILEKWTQLDAKGAITFVAASKGREEKWLGESTVLRTWTRTDASAALAWAQANGKENKENEDPQDGQGGNGRGPGGGPPTSSPTSIVISQLAHTDLERAMSVAAAENLDRRSRTIGTLANELVSQRGLDGARSALEGMAAGSLRDGLTTQLAGKLAEKDAPAAVEWAFGLPEGDAKSRALAETIGEWAKKDAAAAGTFMTKLPATAETDRSRESYANAVVQKDPQGAIAWASTITDKERQQRTVENVARSWVKQDAATAKEWIAQSSLPAEVKTRIQSPSRTGGGGTNGGGFSRSRGPGN